VLKLPSEGFPSKDLLKSQEFIPLSHSVKNAQPKPSSEFYAPCEEPPSACEKALLPFHSSLSEEAAWTKEVQENELKENAQKESATEKKELKEKRAEENTTLLPEEASPEEGVTRRAEREDEVGEMPLVHFHLKPTSRTQRAMPDFISNTHEYSGPLLGKIRCFHGMTLGELANVTRVAQHHLQNIEREHYESLPALVYLRGYLKSVARELGLDMQQVSQSYLDRMQQAKS